MIPICVTRGAIPPGLSALRASVPAASLPGRHPLWPARNAQGDSGRGVWQEAGTVATASAQHSLGPAGLRQTGHVGLGQSFQHFPQLLGHFSCLPWKCIRLYSEKLTSAVPSLDTENGNNVIASRLGQAARPRL